MSSYLTNTDTFPTGRGEPANSFGEFAAGKQFPPERERNRIEQFDRWWRWSHRSFVGLDPAAPAPSAGQEQFDVAGRRQARRLSPNLFRFIMEFWGDAVATDAPVVTYDGGGRPQDFVDRILQPLMRASRLAVSDLVRYGVGVFWSRHALMPEALDPRFWYPIRPAFDPYQAIGEVVATPYSSKPNVVTDRVMIYRYPVDGPAVRRPHTLDGMTIGGAGGAEEKLAEEADGLVVPVTAREGVYGTSDFIDAAEYVAELHRRESSISQALDRHANPHLAVPEGSMRVSADGKVTIDSDGMVIPVPEGTRNNIPAYVTWDASFDAQESAIARAEQRVLRMSNIAPILATPGEFALRGGLPSGAALRRLAVISVNRLKAIREELSTAWKRVLPAQARLWGEQGGERLAFDVERLTIEWPPEFSTIDDEIEAGVSHLGTGEGADAEGQGQQAGAQAQDRS